MRPDRGAVDHLQRVGIAAAVRQRLQHQVPHAGETPASKLLVHRVPVPQHLRQIAPWRTRAVDPKHSIQHLAVVARGAAALWRRMRQEGLEDCPFFVAHQASDHCQPPTQRSASNHTRSASGKHTPTNDTMRIPTGPSRLFSRSCRTVQILSLPTVLTISRAAWPTEFVHRA